MNKNGIPLVDLSAQYATIKKEIDGAIASVIQDTAFIGGTRVQKFEEDFAHMLGVRYCVGVGNGTDAITILLRALGLGDGDEVIVPANSFIATSEAVTAAGARVVFADCDPRDYCISVVDFEKKITPNTRAVIVVHLYGQPAQMDEISSLAKKHNILVIEDTAQAHLAQYKGKSVGTIGVGGTFSFYPGKNLGAYGDAGAIVTSDEELAKRCRMLANHGRAKGEKYNHEIEGYNSRLDGLQAAILSVKLAHLPRWTEARQSIAEKYRKHLGGVGDIVLPDDILGRKSAYHLFVIRTKERDHLREHLKKDGIESGVHYPIGLPFLDAYRRFGHTEKDFPHTAEFQNTILSLPIYPELLDEDLQHIIRSIKDFYVSR